MKKNCYGGKLIVFDGPNGSGKSTLVDRIAKRLRWDGHDVHVTREPTSTPLGEYIREVAEELNGNTLACLVVADRYEHLKNEIIPNLAADKTVIVDRYFLSSLILQRMDKVNVQFIFNINSEIMIPDLQIAVFADDNIIQSRLNKRESLTRFEMGNLTSLELKYLAEGVELLESEGMEVLRVYNNSDSDLDENINVIVNEIISI